MKTLYCTAHVKNDSNSFGREISAFNIVNALINQKRWKTRSWNKFWMRIFTKFNWNLQVSLEWHSKSFPIAYRSWEEFERNPGESRSRITSGPMKQKTLEIIADLSWKILPHAAYSSDMTPSDYYFYFDSYNTTLAGLNLSQLKRYKKALMSI